MSQPQPGKAKKSFPVIKLLVGLVAAGVLLVVGSFAVTANLETHDTFCASCHTQPESTFLPRAQAAAPVDLASYHTTQKTECIDCHSGQGLSGRLLAEFQGAQNAFEFITHTDVQPAVLLYPIGDANCLKCHATVVQRGYVRQTQTNSPIESGGIGHWHQNLARWQAADPNAATCVTCHPGHDTTGQAQNGFLNPATVQPVCDACHAVLRRGG